MNSVDLGLAGQVVARHSDSDGVRGGLGSHLDI